MCVSQIGVCAAKLTNVENNDEFPKDGGIYDVNRINEFADDQGRTVKSTLHCLLTHLGARWLMFYNMTIQTAHHRKIWKKKKANAGDFQSECNINDSVCDLITRQLAIVLDKHHLFWSSVMLLCVRHAHTLLNTLYKVHVKKKQS